MQPDQEFESRANMDSEFIDFEERCENCGRMYIYHETQVWSGTVATLCPEGKGFFELQEKDENL